MSRLEWYQSAAEELGISSLIRLQLQKRFAHDKALCRLTSKALAHPVLARKGSSDFCVFDQIFVEREYRCLDFIEAPTLVMDCGANVGYSSAYFLSRYPKCCVLAVEPDPGNFALLQRNIRPFGERCRTIQAAVWPRDEMLHFKQPALRGAEWACSVENGASDGAAVRGISIPTLLEMAPVGRVSILKIDIEGAEVELFDRDTGWIELIDNIVIELHDGVSRGKFLKAIRDQAFDVSICGELTCCVSR